MAARYVPNTPPPCKEEESRIKPGMLVSTSIGSGPYVIRKVVRACTCAGSRGVVTGDPTPTAPHIHLVCMDPTNGTTRYLNGYCEYTLKSVWGFNAWISIEGVDPEEAPADPDAPDQHSLF